MTSLDTKLPPSAKPKRSKSFLRRMSKLVTRSRSFGKSRSKSEGDVLTSPDSPPVSPVKSPAKPKSPAKAKSPATPIFSSKARTSARSLTPAASDTDSASTAGRVIPFTCSHVSADYSQTFVAYSCEFSSGKARWHISRRFSEWRVLCDALAAPLPAAADVFPPRMINWAFEVLNWMGVPAALDTLIGERAEAIGAFVKAVTTASERDLEVRATLAAWLEKTA